MTDGLSNKVACPIRRRRCEDLHRLGIRSDEEQAGPAGGPATAVLVGQYVLPSRRDRPVRCPGLEPSQKPLSCWTCEPVVDILPPSPPGRPSLSPHSPNGTVLPWPISPSRTCPCPGPHKGTILPTRPATTRPTTSTGSPVWTGRLHFALCRFANLRGREGRKEEGDPGGEKKSSQVKGFSRSVAHPLLVVHMFCCPESS